MLQLGMLLKLSLAIAITVVGDFVLLQGACLPVQKLCALSPSENCLVLAQKTVGSALFGCA